MPLRLRLSLQFLLGWSCSPPPGSGVGGQLRRRDAGRFGMASDLVARARNAVWLYRKCDRGIHTDSGPQLDRSEGIRWRPVDCSCDRMVKCPIVDCELVAVASFVA